jgi:hypothetical protein
MAISAILPLKTRGRHYADNIARCDILFSSLRAFTSPAIFDRILVVVPHDEVADARRYAVAWSDFPVEVIDEADHFQVFAEFSARHQIRPWHRQQIIKLYAARLIDSEYLLVLDPDCFATRPFDLETLLPGGRALTYMQPRELESGYWRDSAAVLRQEPNVTGDGIWMTPALLSRTLCLNLHRRLEELYGESWMRVLLARYMVNWTEYTLYWLNAERDGLIEKFHTGPQPGMPALHTDESVWFAENLSTWDAARHFTADGNGIFALVQSNTRIPVATVVKKLEPFLPLKLQPYDRHQSLTLKLAELYSALARRALAFTRRLFNQRSSF